MLAPSPLLPLPSRWPVYQPEYKVILREGDEMAGFTPDLDRDAQGSPDRVDALVWAITELLVKRRPILKATSHRL
jgi:hypothetical protein